MRDGERVEQRVFLSYSQFDQEYAAAIEQLLTSNAISCCLDAKDIDLGAEIDWRVSEGMSSCSTVIVIVSPATAKSPWVLYELGLARGTGKRIIPFLTHPLQDVPPFLNHLKVARNLDELSKLFSIGTTPGLRLAAPPPASQSVDKLVVVVGGANAEYALETATSLTPGQKYDVSGHALFGGSGVNHTMRLLNAGIPVLPILLLGDDEVGRQIQRNIVSAARNTPRAREIEDFVNHPDFFVPGLATGRSTIVVDNQNRTRTILREPAKGLSGVLPYLKKRFETARSGFKRDIGFVMIGHIQADRRDASGTAGQCTREVIRQFAQDGCAVFANFGSTQTDLGWQFWAEDLERIAVFQLNLTEARSFFGEPRLSLEEIVGRIQQLNLTGVITLDRFGAVCTFRGVRESVILAWPFRLEHIVDTTGAGDAFGAGLVSVLCRERAISYGHMFAGVDEARAWAAYACTKFGGAADCPDRATLSTFRDALLEGSRGIEVKEKSLARDIFWMMDHT
ncbi:MAG TPA: PfkB family carbohydrate kinase [Polyangia bacterium]|nr:PfkB family carbohydrate kinase [Polyangia bacterium]